MGPEDNSIVVVETFGVSTRAMGTFVYVFKCSSCGAHHEVNHQVDPGPGQRELVTVFETSRVLLVRNGVPRCVICLSIPILFSSPRRS